MLRTLAGALRPGPIWPGAVRHVQSLSGLKSAPACRFRRCSTPGCPVCHRATALNSRRTKARPTMQTFTPSDGRSSASGLFAPFLPAIALKSFKQALGDEIERLIALADEIDGDPDLEPDLAGTPNQGAACDAEGDDSDLEPSLGSLGGTAQGFWYATPSIWAAGSLSDAELDDCDLEDGHDAEDDPAERGIGDEDGLEEQTGLFDRSGDEPGARAPSTAARRTGSCSPTSVGMRAKPRRAIRPARKSPHAAYLLIGRRVGDRAMSADRRTFLRGLTSLPLIGGSVALIGAPSAVAEPATLPMLLQYANWLFYERRLLCREIGGAAGDWHGGRHLDGRRLD